MLDHIGLAVRDFGRSVTFYRRALAPLGVQTVLEGEGWAMLGKDAGGRDNGAPGLRPKYHPSYYGAFVFDPDGHNIEAVCHAPQ
jgi:catechol 2,3-dioxygenase-like lactoylglutathione lyase family enzyme